MIKCPLKIYKVTISMLMMMGIESMIHNKIVKRRTIRKYSQKRVPDEILRKCVNAARLSPCTLNQQPLKYVIVNDDQLLKQIFEITTWAAWLPTYSPSEEEMAKAYIVILADKEIEPFAGSHTPYDVGVVTMSISMTAFDEGLGSCILASVNKKKLRKILNIPENLRVEMVVSLGYSADSPVVDEVKDEKVNYWLDDDGVLHVPKRDLEDVMHQNSY